MQLMITLPIFCVESVFVVTFRMRTPTLTHPHSHTHISESSQTAQQSPKQPTQSVFSQPPNRSCECMYTQTHTPTFTLSSSSTLPSQQNAVSHPQNRTPIRDPQTARIPNPHTHRNTTRFPAQTAAPPPRHRSRFRRAAAPSPLRRRRYLTRGPFRSQPSAISLTI